jgi:hypothetical protein
MPDEVLAAYHDAWNAPDAQTRAQLLERSLTPDAELVDPRAGRFSGRDAIEQRLAGFGERFPGARVDLTSGVDEHNGYARYSWTIVDREGDPILAGIDVTQRGDDGRLELVVMFFGELPAPPG